MVNLCNVISTLKGSSCTPIKAYLKRLACVVPNHRSWATIIPQLDRWVCNVGKPSMENIFLPTNKPYCNSLSTLGLNGKLKSSAVGFLGNEQMQFPVWTFFQVIAWNKNFLCRQQAIKMNCLVYSAWTEKDRQMSIKLVFSFCQHRKVSGSAHTPWLRNCDNSKSLIFLSQTRNTRYEKCVIRQKSIIAKTFLQIFEFASS